MRTDKQRILIVDDSPNDIHIIIENLKEHHAVIASTSGSKALELAAKDPRPDVILMDVEMPEMNGYQVCRQLKSQSLTADIPVIFISAHDTIEEKLAGYEAGGSDYLIKPLQPAELLHKVEIAISQRAERIANAAEREMAMQTAMTAMTNSGELGVVLEFLRQSFSLSTPTSLGEHIIHSTEGYELECSVQIRSSLGEVNVCDDGAVPPLEAELMRRLKDSGRILERGSRLIVTFDNVSLLVKNLPQDDDRRGRLRDHLAILIEGANARLQTLEVTHQNNSRKQLLENLIEESNHALSGIQQRQQQHKERAMNIVDQMLVQLNDAFIPWGLTEEQEERLLKVVENGGEQALDNYEQGLAIDKQLQEIVQRMSEINTN